MRKGIGLDRGPEQARHLFSPELAPARAAFFTDAAYGQGIELRVLRLVGKGCGGQESFDTAGCARLVSSVGLKPGEISSLASRITRRYKAGLLFRNKLLLKWPGTSSPLSFLLVANMKSTYPSIWVFPSSVTCRNFLIICISSGFMIFAR